MTVSYKIYTNNGIVLNTVKTSSSDGNISLDLSVYLPGLYFIGLTSKEGITETLKIIKQK